MRFLGWALSLSERHIACWRLLLYTFAMHVVARMAMILSLAPFAALSGPLGQFEGQTDVGDPKIAGSCQYDRATQEYAISGAGSNMWFQRDEFHFVWKKMKGDFLLRTRFEWIGKGAVDHRKVGWMVRPNLEPTAPYVDCAVHGDGLTTLQYRAAVGSNTDQINLSVTNADVLQFERKGNTYTFSAARYGEPFVSEELADFNLGEDVYVGLFVCSHTEDAAEKAIFRDVRVVKPVKEGFVPYREFIGSLLEILDLQSGHLQTIYQSANEPFEAPNWTRDGASLIYNVSGRGPGWGRLCRFDLAQNTPTTIPLEIGPDAVRNNNDHVLSLDGSMLAISDQSQSHGGQSAVFTVPLQGGPCKRVTPLSPSYAHGWSPDGKFLVYTGGRSNKFDIYKMAAGGGDEIRLTDADGLNDGPEFTPDGKYIYFNSSRTGLMQIWRMKPDGSEQEQVTHSEFNDWFPHISPDGKWIVFISFPKDVKATDHPYYQRVYLRLMPLDGSEPRVIAYVYGGQGTMNVPSWSPDGKKLAFVSNNNFE